MEDYTTPADNALGNKLKSLRKQRNWTQGKIAEQLGLSIPALSKIEGGFTNVNITRLKQLAEIFNTTTDHLLHTSIEQATREKESELKKLKTLYEQKTTELIVLQIKAIKLYDELHNRKDKGKK